MASRAGFILKGFDETIAKLKRLGDKKLLKKTTRKAANAAANPVVKAVRSLWPVRSGVSKKAVTKKIVSGRSGYTAIIGIDKSVVAEVDGRVHIPANIDHLVELGFQRRDGSTVAAVAPLRRGHAAAKDEAERIFAEKSAAEIEKEALKAL